MLGFMGCGPPSPVQQLPAEDPTYTFEILLDGPDPTGGGGESQQVIFSSTGLRELIIPTSIYAEEQYGFGTSGCSPTQLFPQCGELATVPSRGLLRDVLHQGTTPFPLYARLRANDIPLPSYIHALADANSFDPKPFLAPYEAHLFTSDYEDAFLALTRNTAEPLWLGLTRNMVPAVVLPATLTPSGSSPTTLRLAPGAFGLQNKPFASIKSVYISQPGACSRQFDYGSTFFGAIDASVRAGLFVDHGAACFKSYVKSLKLDSDNFASFIAHTRNRLQDVRGGFVFNGSIHLAIHDARLSSPAFGLDSRRRPGAGSGV